MSQNSCDYQLLLTPAGQASSVSSNSLGALDLVMELVEPSKGHAML